MKLYLQDQRDKLSDHLPYYRAKRVTKYNRNDLIQKSASVEINLDWDKRGRAENLLFNYRIFPENILTGYGDWQYTHRTMQAGDTIVQQACIPPRTFISQKLIFGVRVNNVWRFENEFGFSYETLEGHPELGESKFIIQRMGPHTLFTISTASMPGSWLTKLVGPVFTLPYQAYCTRKALNNVKCMLSATT